jgi:hypothetical protein
VLARKVQARRQCGHFVGAFDGPNDFVRPAQDHDLSIGRIDKIEEWAIAPKEDMMPAFTITAHPEEDRRKKNSER